MINTSTIIEPSKFSRELYQRINHYFTENNISKRADRRMNAKIIGGLSWLLLSYLALYFFNLEFWQFLLIYILNGLAQVFIFLNISHDANHHSISHRKSINTVLSYSLDICGISSYMWRILHHRGHHSRMNIYGEDEAILSRGLIRMSPHAPWNKFYRYQHLYAFLLYCIVSLDFVFFKDFYFFFLSDYKYVKEKKHALKEYLKLFGSKIFYISYMIILPVYILNFSLWQVIIAFLIAHFIMGLITTLVIQTTHVIESSEFPESVNEYDNYVNHIFATTADYSTRNPIANLFCGGLHQHVIHHLCPNICHTHYTTLTGIVKSTAEEFGIDYRENRTMYKALVKHYRLLKQLGSHA